MRNALAGMALVLAVACGRDGAAPAGPDAVTALPLETLVAVSVAAECARLEAGKAPGAIEPYLREVLETRRLGRAEYDEAARLHPEAVRFVDARLGECRTAAGYRGRPLDGGVVWEKLPP